MSQIPILRSSGSSGSSSRTSPQGSNNQSSIASIIASLEQSQKAANDANQQRYTGGLEELESGRESMRQYFAQANSLIQDIGSSAIEDINRGSERSFAMGRQHLISSGLSNTTITNSLIRGTEEDRRREMERVEEQRATAQAGLNERQAGAELGASGNIAQFMAARNDIGPDPASYAGLIQAASATNTSPIQASLGASAGQAPINAGQSGLIRPTQYGAGGGNSAASGSNAGQAPGTGGGGIQAGGSYNKATIVGPGKGKTIPGKQQGGVYGQGGQAISPIAKKAGPNVSTYNPWAGNRNISGRLR